jgi:hypothetical protein
MRKLIVAAGLLASLGSFGWEPVLALESDTKPSCHEISNPDAFIKDAAAKASVMTVVHAVEFGKMAGYEEPLIAVFILPDDKTLIVVSQHETKFAECFTSVHEDAETWATVQKFFGRGA